MSGRMVAVTFGLLCANAAPLRAQVDSITDADRAAAFPEVAGHAVHDRSVHSFLQVNRLEAWDADAGTGVAWEGQGWIGGDLTRMWIRSEGARVGGHTESADAEVLYGKAVARWWDLVAGVRQDFRPGEAQTWAAVGVIGLAPYKFEIEATAYVGESGQTAARFEAEYELLLTNRLILQPLLEIDVYGKDDAARGIAAGLSTVEAGIRLRYELTRKFAPYLGVVHERKFEDSSDDTRFVAGIRTWF